MAYIDIESFSSDGKPQIVIMPEPNERQRHYFRDGAQSVAFECSLDHSDKNVERFMNALMLPERKFIRWRKKKMLVSKTRHQPVQMNVTFDLAQMSQMGALRWLEWHE